MQTVSGECFKVTDIFRTKIFFICESDDCAGERVFTAHFKGVCQTQEFVFTYTCCRNNVCHDRLTGSYSACLVEDCDLHFACLFNGDCGLEEYTVSGADTVSDHYCDRCSESECTRTAYNKYRDSPCECESGTFSDEKPYNRCQYSYSDYSRNEYTCDFVGSICNGSLCSGSVSYHFNYLRESGILAYAGSAALEKSRLIKSSGGNAVSHGFIGGDTFTGESRFVHGTASLNYNSVNRYAFSGTHYEYVSGENLSCGHSYFFAVTNQVSSFRSELHEAFQCVSSFAF